MRVLVFPHDLEMGGSQLNAIEIAAATRDLGHDVVIFGRPGHLQRRIDELGLEFIPSPEPHLRPTPSIVRALRGIARTRGIDVLHGYEWPPILEARLAAVGRRAPTCVGTIMSMSVAPFIPKDIPLVVGTRQIAMEEKAAGRRHLEVIEPPVDTTHNRPDPESGAEARRRYGISTTATVVASVCRLVPTLKLEGLLCAIATLPGLPQEPVFLIAGGGPAHRDVARAAAAANERAGRRAVVLAGEVEDPRPVYAAADVVLGMGGSILRAMAMAKPVVVQGENGFWTRLTPQTLESFLWTGWYGVGSDPRQGASRLTHELVPLLQDARLRSESGEFGRATVQAEFSLRSAAETQVRQYRWALSSGVGAGGSLRCDAPAAARLLSYTVHREISLRRRQSHEDFNARPVAGRGVQPFHARVASHRNQEDEGMTTPWR